MSRAFQQKTTYSIISTFRSTTKNDANSCAIQYMDYFKLKWLDEHDMGIRSNPPFQKLYWCFGPSDPFGQHNESLGGNLVWG